MIHKLIIFTNSLLIFSLLSCDKQRDPAEEIIAKIGNLEITKEELANRAEFFPPPKFTSVNGKTGNAALLELLVGEKLMAQAAKQANLDTTAWYREQIEHVLLKAAVRKFIKEEVKDKIDIDSAEIIDAFEKSGKKYVVKLFQTRREENAAIFYEKLRNGRNFDQVMSEIHGGRIAPEKYTREITWGEVDEQMENAIFSMKSGETSQPVKFSRGYAIVKVDNIFVNPLATSGNEQQRKSGIEKTLRARKMKRLTGAFVADFMNRRKVVVKGKVFHALANWLDRAVEYKSEPGSPLLSKNSAEINIDSLKFALEDNLAASFVTFEGGRFTLKKVLQKLRVRQIGLNDESPPAMRKQLHSDLKMIVTEELLAQEARRRKLQNRPDVQKEIQLWRNYYLAQLFVRVIDFKPTKRPKIVFPDTLLALRRKAQIEINHDALNSLRFSPLPMVAMRPGRTANLVVPPWPVF